MYELKIKYDNLVLKRRHLLYMGILYYVENDRIIKKRRDAKSRIIKIVIQTGILIQKLFEHIFF